MRTVGVLLGLFGAGGVVTAIMRVLHSQHVEPIGVALLALMAVGGVVLFGLGMKRARAAGERAPEVAVLGVAERHGGRVTAVLVAAETKIAIDAAQRELVALAERGVCVRRSDDGGTPYFLFPELESEEVKKKLFFSDETRRAQAAAARDKVGQ